LSTAAESTPPLALSFKPLKKANFLGSVGVVLENGEWAVGMAGESEREEQSVDGQLKRATECEFWVFQEWVLQLAGVNFMKW
jgi:hypothetical protein